jgi:hypothetical protein
VPIFFNFLFGFVLFLCNHVGFHRYRTGTVNMSYFTHSLINNLKITGQQLTKREKVLISRFHHRQEGNTMTEVN